MRSSKRCSTRIPRRSLARMAAGRSCSQTRRWSRPAAAGRPSGSACRREVKTLFVGLIGSGFMGKAHAWAYRHVGAVFRMPVAPVLEILADATPELAATAARDLGFARSTGDWRELVTDPRVDIVNITTPP